MKVDDEKIEQADIALRLAGFNWNKRGVEHVLRILEEVEEKGDDLTVKDIFRIEHEIELKYEK